jgi:hypothetical protein
MTDGPPVRRSRTANEVNGTDESSLSEGMLTENARRGRMPAVAGGIGFGSGIGIGIGIGLVKGRLGQQPGEADGW